MRVLALLCLLMTGCGAVREYWRAGELAPATRTASATPTRAHDRRHATAVPHPERAVARQDDAEIRRAKLRAMEAAAAQQVDVAQTVPPEREPAAPETRVAENSPQRAYRSALELDTLQIPTSQDRIAAIATELGGYLSSQQADSIVIQVPASRFQEAMHAIAACGEIRSRTAVAVEEDPGTQDLVVRVRNLTAVRERLEGLLHATTNTDQVLSVEHELERVTLDLETTQARLHTAQERTLYSTLSISLRRVLRR